MGLRSCSECVVEYRLPGYQTTFKVFDYPLSQTTEVHADLVVPPPLPGQVKGFAVDVRLRSLPDCIVTVGQVTKISTSGCNVQFDEVAPGSQTVTVQRAGHQVFSTTLNVPAGGTAYLGGGPGVGTVVPWSVGSFVGDANQKAKLGDSFRLTTPQFILDGNLTKLKAEFLLKEVQPPEGDANQCALRKVAEFCATDSDPLGCIADLDPRAPAGMIAMCAVGAKSAKATRGLSLTLCAPLIAKVGPLVVDVATCYI